MRIKKRPVPVGFRFATCYCTSRLRHVFAQQLLSLRRQMAVVRKYFEIHSVQVIATSSLLLHTPPCEYKLPKYLPKHTLRALVSRSSLVFTLNQFKGGARKVDVMLWRLKRRTRMRDAADLLCNLHSKLPLH